MPQALTITEIETTGAGSIPAGALEVSIINTGATDALLSSIAGTGRVPAGSSKQIGSQASTLPEIFYNGNGNQCYITIIRR